MANFNVAFLNPKLAKGNAADYSYLVDGITVLKNQLESDGKLSPGDYDLLTSKARALYGHPGLTPSQRGSLDSMISGFQKDKQVGAINDTTDISRINRDMEDDNAQATIHFGNDPQKFLQAKAESLKTKIGVLSEAIDQKESSGADASSHQNELTSTLNDYHDTLAAIHDMKQIKEGTKTKSDYAAYVTTNSNGEIVSMKVGRVGSQSGYLPTNGVYGGLSLYGKANTINGNNQAEFRLGNQTFTEGQDVVTSPDGASVQKKLIAGGPGRGGFSRNSPSYVVDPATVKTQSAIPDGGYIDGGNGSIYQRNSDGSFKRYVNADKSKLNIDDSQIIRMPDSFIKSITPNVKETIDASTPTQVPTPLPGNAPNTTGMTAPQAEPALKVADQQPEAKSTQNTGGAPTVRSPFTTGGIAANAIKTASGFLGKIFGQ